ncbi:MAG TPA: DNA gyrase subunit A [Dehalococcoidia bacterium]|nr:DNA gyrase subunit A [Dehalococcoidia bacterium]
MQVGVVKPVVIEEEMKSSYLDYAMSVIVSRALPDVRDGLKPVHRRILYAMDGLGLRHTGSYKKSARIVGEVLGKYHPHGDAPVYEAMVRMAQDFSMRYSLVDGQGNFGSMDNDPPAAMRYTEARLAKIAEEMLVDIDKDTVDFVPNFDGSLKEPSVLPARLPNLLVNGSSGIAVGMATNIPPHNLSEICDAVNYLIDNSEADVDELMQFVKGPDFPTAGIIWGRKGVKDAYASGQGKVVVRAKVTEESLKSGRGRLVITELPYQTNKAALVERIAELAKERKIEGINEVRDESDRQGMRMVIELRKEAQPAKVLNNLYKYTSMQSAFFINMLALVDGQPQVINLKEALTCYIDFRKQVITRRCQFELQKARDRAHILEGFRIALDHLDQVIETIRKSETADSARTNLMNSFSLSQIQAQAILDMQLRRLAHLEQKKIVDEYSETVKTIAYLEDLLANPKKILFLIQQDVTELKSNYGGRRCTLIKREEAEEFQDEDLIPHQNVVITLSEQGYIKRILATTYQKQHRGGRGIMGMATRETDVVRQLLVADTHDSLLLFTNRGKVYRLRCYDIPQDISRTTKGTALANLLPVDPTERITALVVAKDSAPGSFMVMATSRGIVKKTSFGRFASVRSSGLIAMRLPGEEELIAADVVTETDKVILITQNGQAIKFAVKDLRDASRVSGGVRGIRLSPDDRLVGMDTVFPDAHLLTVTENGFGKLSRVSSYPAQARGGKGLRAHRVTEKTGRVIAAKLIPLSQHLIIISAKGIVIRIPVDEEIPLQGRATQGVHLNKLDRDDKVVSIAYIHQGENREDDRAAAE